MSRRARVLLCCLVLSMGSIQASVAFSRSLIPYAIDGRVEASEYVSGSGRQLHVVTIDGQTYQTDNIEVAEVRRGARVQTAAWSNWLVVDGRSGIRLIVGDQVFQFAALGLASVAAAWRLSRPTRRKDGHSGSVA